MAIDVDNDELSKISNMRPMAAWIRVTLRVLHVT